MKNIYDEKVEQFCATVFLYIKKSQGRLKCLPEEYRILDYSGKWGKDMRDCLEYLSARPECFADKNISDKNIKDYRAYYAFLNVYHAIKNYYDFHAVYNSRDERLERALLEWYQFCNVKNGIKRRAQTVNFNVSRYLLREMALIH